MYNEFLHKQLLKCFWLIWNENYYIVWKWSECYIPVFLHVYIYEIFCQLLHLNWNKIVLREQRFLDITDESRMWRIVHYPSSPSFVFLSSIIGGFTLIASEIDIWPRHWSRLSGIYCLMFVMQAMFSLKKWFHSIISKAGARFTPVSREASVFGYSDICGRRTNS